MVLNDIIHHSAIEKWCDISQNKTGADVKAALAVDRVDINHFLSLLSPAAEDHLELLAQRSREITIQRFGKTIQLYTPIYLSNFCHNSCVYCGFNVKSTITRKIQSVEAVEEEAKYLKRKGFKNILLVAGDDPQVTMEYLRDVIKRLHDVVPSLCLEIAPKTEEQYSQLKTAGAEGVIVYQETYQENLYTGYHPNGKKSDYFHRLGTPERVGKAGLYRIGIGVLLGLGNPVYEGIALFLHAGFLLKHFWKSQITISLPRLRKASGAIEPPMPVSDRQFTQLICALRIALPDVGILLSTREEPALRDQLIQIGITQLSAGSRTEPGGYLTPDHEGEQFTVEDRRSPQEVAQRLRTIGYEPVWKDWEKTLNDTLHG